MSSERRSHLDLWSLLAISAAAGTILVEVGYQWPLALLDEWARILRA